MTQEEQDQILQTVEMFEVVVQSNPEDTQSMEVLKEAYVQMGRLEDALRVSKMIAQVNVDQGQLSSAILEYEMILDYVPDDPDAKAALQQIESQAAGYAEEQNVEGAASDSAKDPWIDEVVEACDDGRQQMFQLMSRSQLLKESDFDAYWPIIGESENGVQKPFLLTLHERNVLQIEKSLPLICEKTHLGFVPLEHYDIDIQFARNFPKELCQKWCVLPFDWLSKNIMVATANPFNQQAAVDLGKITRNRIIWYLASPNALMESIRRIFR